MSFRKKEKWRLFSFFAALPKPEAVND